MQHFLRAFRGEFLSSLAVHFQYRMGMILRLIGNILGPVIYLMTWCAVAENQGGSVSGQRMPEFAAYYLTLLLVSHLGYTWLPWRYEFRIRYGAFSTQLLQPQHPLVRDVAENLSHKLLSMMVILPVLFFLSWAFQAAWTITPVSLVLFLVAMTNAFILRFILEWMISLAAFWTVRNSGVMQAYFFLLFLVSGQAAPLILMPGWLAKIAVWTPFYLIMGFPADVLLHRLPGQEILVLFLRQVMWMGIMGVLAAVIWKRGIRQYSAVGA